MGVATAAAAVFLALVSGKPPEKLSDLGLFVGPLKDLRPAPGVVPYELNAALFSDYAFKLRFIRLPEGQAATYDPEEVFAFPVGTLLVKNFYYPYDFRKPEAGRHILETRILAHTLRGWEAWPYVWNADQSEAFYDVAGSSLPVSWIHFDGKKKSISYVVPNKNQCKQCHEYKGALSPIGPAARHLNKNVTFWGEAVNQLEFWSQKGWLRGFPGKEMCERNAAPDDARVPLEKRARSYLDINCGHCHRPEGQAASSGLFLNIREKDPMRLGVLKAPVAAGRAAAHMRFSIEPGHPERSIMIYRMASLDPGIMMPEMGRRTVDEEGLALLREWIAQMKP